MHKSFNSPQNELSQYEEDPADSEIFMEVTKRVLMGPANDPDTNMNASCDFEFNESEIGMQEDMKLRTEKRRPRASIQMSLNYENTFGYIQESPLAQKLKHPSKGRSKK